MRASLTGNPDASARLLVSERISLRMRAGRLGLDGSAEAGAECALLGRVARATQSAKAAGKTGKGRFIDTAREAGKGAAGSQWAAARWLARRIRRGSGGTFQKAGQQTRERVQVTERACKSLLPSVSCIREPTSCSLGEDDLQKRPHRWLG
jgi:hypothetical protein